VTATTTGQVSPDLRATLRALKLGQMLDTLPERLTLARQQKMTHADFLELILADEVTRRESRSAGLRSASARPTWPPRSAASPSGVAAPSTWPRPASSSSG
jgi:hypothetical protein